MITEKIKDKEVRGDLQLIHGEALEIMDKLIYEGIIVDAIICDPLLMALQSIML